MSKDFDGLALSQYIRNGRHQHERGHETSDDPINTVDPILHVAPVTAVDGSARQLRGQHVDLFDGRRLGE
jgi:hypothetical protein